MYALLPLISDAVGCADLLRFVTDLDPQTLAAIIETASEFEAWELRDSIYNHLAFKSAIRAITQVRKSEGSLVKY
jgi:hypothetical protein